MIKHDCDNSSALAMELPQPPKEGAKSEMEF